MGQGQTMMGHNVHLFELSQKLRGGLAWGLVLRPAPTWMEDAPEESGFQENNQICYDLSTTIQFLWTYFMKKFLFMFNCSWPQNFMWSLMLIKVWSALKTASVAVVSCFGFSVCISKAGQIVTAGSVMLSFAMVKTWRKVNFFASQHVFQDNSNPDSMDKQNIRTFLPRAKRRFCQQLDDQLDC